jgi:SAM-dependent methyltransferase
LFDDLVELGHLRPGDRVLEIGPGTGQATVPMAERGLNVTAIELGPGLAAVARRKLARFPLATIVEGAFEDWPLPGEPFDAVVAATAFHWLDQSVRVTKAADALRAAGVLATIATHHVAGGDGQFFLDAQDCYRRWFDDNADVRLPSGADVRRDSSELEESGRFEPATFRRYEWEATYSTQQYVDLLSTYSDHRALAATRRRRLFECIARLIDQRYGGRIRKRYLNELRIAQRR